MSMNSMHITRHFPYVADAILKLDNLSFTVYNSNITSLNFIFTNFVLCTVFLVTELNININQ